MFKKKKSLAQIVSSFTKVVTDLNELISANEGQIKENNAAIEKLEHDNHELTVEGAQAMTVRDNIEKLLK